MDKIEFLKKHPQRYQLFYKYAWFFGVIIRYKQWQRYVLTFLASSVLGACWLSLFLPYYYQLHALQASTSVPVPCVAPSTIACDKAAYEAYCPKCPPDQQRHLLTILNTYASEHAITLHSYQPQPMVAHEAYNELSMVVVLEMPYEQLAPCVHALLIHYPTLTFSDIRITKSTNQTVVVTAQCCWIQGIL